MMTLVQVTRRARRASIPRDTSVMCPPQACKGPDIRTAFPQCQSICADRRPCRAAPLRGRLRMSQVIMESRLVLIFPVLAAASLGVAVSALPQRGSPPPDRFDKRVVTTGLDNPFQIVWGPDEHLWVTERTAGRITRVRPSDGTKTTAFTIADVLQYDGPGGLLGMTFAPGLAFVYVAYTYDDDPAPQK